MGVLHDQSGNKNHMYGFRWANGKYQLPPGHIVHEPEPPTAMAFGTFHHFASDGKAWVSRGAGYEQQLMLLPFDGSASAGDCAYMMPNGVVRNTPF